MLIVQEKRKAEASSSNDSTTIEISSVFSVPTIRDHTKEMKTYAHELVWIYRRKFLSIHDCALLLL